MPDCDRGCFACVHFQEKKQTHCLYVPYIELGIMVLCIRLQLIVGELAFIDFPNYVTFSRYMPRRLSGKSDRFVNFKFSLRLTSVLYLNMNQLEPNIKWIIQIIK